MLQQFQVKNYKCFEDLTLNLESAEYSFKPELVKDGLVSKALVYGKNGSGKSSLGFALFDIVHHLTDNHTLPQYCREYYKNLNTDAQEVFFQYTFIFDYKILVYTYTKNSYGELIWESLRTDKDTLLDYHYNQDGGKYISPDLQKNINIDLRDNKLSVLKYIYRTSPTGTNHLLSKLIHFCESMLWIRSLSEDNNYCGLTNANWTLDQMLYENGYLKEFQAFLHRCDLDYELDFENDGGRPVIYAYFNNRERKAPFSSIASAGTKSLWLFFSWMTFGKDRISFLFIDEFDAFYNYEIAASVVDLINSKKHVQSILTTHNTYLMKNTFTRPDCCFLLTQNSIKNLKDSTDRELREAHNLEKLYVNGAFTE